MVLIFKKNSISIPTWITHWIQHNSLFKFPYPPPWPWICYLRIVDRNNCCTSFGTHSARQRAPNSAGKFPCQSPFENFPSWIAYTQRDTQKPFWFSTRTVHKSCCPNRDTASLLCHLFGRGLKKFTVKEWWLWVWKICSELVLQLIKCTNFWSKFWLSRD